MICSRVDTRVPGPLRARPSTLARAVVGRERRGRFRPEVVPRLEHDRNIDESPDSLAMFRHVVTFRWKPETGPDAAAELSAALGELPAVIPVLRDYRFGPDAGLSERTTTSPWWPTSTRAEDYLGLPRRPGPSGGHRSADPAQRRVAALGAVRARLTRSGDRRRPSQRRCGAADRSQQDVRETRPKARRRATSGAAGRRGRRGQGRRGRRCGPRAPLGGWRARTRRHRCGRARTPTRGVRDGS